MCTAINSAFYQHSFNTEHEFINFLQFGNFIAFDSGLNSRLMLHELEMKQAAV